MTYEELIRAIGPGFHPDTRGEDYTSLPEGVAPEMVDSIVDEAFLDDGAELDPYARALDLLHEMLQGPSCDGCGGEVDPLGVCGDRVCQA